MQDTPIDAVMEQDGPLPYNAFFVFQPRFEALHVSDAVIEFEAIDSDLAGVPLSLDIFDGERYRGEIEGADCFTGAACRDTVKALVK